MMRIAEKKVCAGAGKSGFFPEIYMHQVGLLVLCLGVII